MLLNWLRTRMAWPKRVLASLALVGATLWLTTAAVSAQSVGLPSAPQTTASPPKADQVVHQAAKAAPPAAQAVKQAAAPASQTAKQVTSTASQPVSQTAKSASKALPITPPTPAVSIQKAPTPVAQVIEPVVHKAKAAVQEVVTEVASSAPEPVPQVVETVISVVSNQAPVVANVTRDEPPPETAETIDEPASEPVEVQAPRVVRSVAVPIASVRRQPLVQVVEAPAAEEPVAALDDLAAPTQADESAAPERREDQPEAVLPLGEAILAIHDRVEPTAPAMAPAAAPRNDIENWPALVAEEPAVAVEDVVSSATVAKAAVPTVAPAASPNPQGELARGDVEPINNEPALPSQPLTVTSASSAAGWLAGPASVSVHESWTSLFPIGPMLPSVIVLPNLTPPG
jgi:ribonuclease E